MRLFRILLALVLVGVVVPAGPAGARQATDGGTFDRVVRVPGVLGDWDRGYRVHVPAGGAGGPRPLVVALHGGLNDGKALEGQSGLSELADERGFVVAYPDGLLGTWNAGGCCGVARIFGIDDVDFLDQLIDGLVGEGLADPERVYLAGFSNGGGMAYRYACERAEKVAAIGVVSGALGTLCQPKEPVSVIAFHGTGDFAVPYGGGGNMDAGVELPFLPVEWVMEFWRHLAKLPGLVRPYLREAGTRCRTTGPGRQAEVALCTVRDGGHEWPTTRNRAGVDGAAVLWSFFSSR